MRVKNNTVDLSELKLEMQPLLKHADDIWKSVLGVEAVITSGCEAAGSDNKLLHSPGSLHYYGYAVDLRTWSSKSEQLPHETKVILANYLRNALKPYSDYYDVIIEKTHIHAEYDILRKKREAHGSAKIF